MAEKHYSLCEINVLGQRKQFWVILPDMFTFLLLVLFFLFFKTEQHPISSAIDGTNNWWQSPSIQNGRQYHWVTITLDLRQVSNVYPRVTY